jgi:hypothetical protein
MESELISYAKTIFNPKEDIYLIISNLAYTICFNESCKDIYLYGDYENVNDFISILKHSLKIK